jgi:glycosyltransferase involved in cell wall biosynthesis
MKIAVLSDVENSGGANIAAVRLTEGFHAAGHEVVRIYQTADADARFDTRLIRSAYATHELPLPARLAWRTVPRGLHRRIHERRSEARLAAILDEVRPDVVNVHNLHIGAWSPEMIRTCAAYAPVVCKLCDTWTFTGRCYNPGPCEKYLSRCDESCPTAGEYPALEPRLIGPAFDRRKEILERCENVAAVAPSRWIGRLAAAGLWRHRPVFRIPNGIDLATYAPIERAVARRTLGLGSHAPVLLCTAALLSERKKGFPLLVEALQHGIGMRVQLLLLGEPAPLPRLADVDVHSLGYIRDDRTKALAYNSADVYVHPSLADNSPNTVIESLACGTPVAAFAVDGVPEMVAQGRTGWLASPPSSEALRRALDEALQSVCGGVDLRAGCRAFAEATYDMPSVIRKHERVFAEMIGGAGVAPGYRSVEEEACASCP